MKNKKCKWEIVDSSNNIIIDDELSESYAKKEVAKLNTIHNPPTYYMRKQGVNDV